MNTASTASTHGPPRDAPVARGAEAFSAHGCAACHTIRGTPADGVIGPDFTHVGGRMSVGAGLLENDAGAFRRWIASTEHLKPGVHVPQFGMLPDADLQALAAYLESLVRRRDAEPLVKAPPTTSAAGREERRRRCDNRSGGGRSRVTRQTASRSSTATPVGASCFTEIQWPTRHHAAAPTSALLRRRPRVATTTIFPIRPRANRRQRRSRTRRPTRDVRAVLTSPTEPLARLRLWRRARRHGLR
jgi:cytochrome c2